MLFVHISMLWKFSSLLLIRSLDVYDWKRVLLPFGAKRKQDKILSICCNHYILTTTMFDEKEDDDEDNDDDDFDDVEYLQDDEQQCRRSPWFARRQLQVKLFLV